MKFVPLQQSLVVACQKRSSGQLSDNHTLMCEQGRVGTVGAGGGLHAHLVKEVHVCAMLGKFLWMIRSPMLNA